MDKEKIKALKIIQEARDNNWSPDYESLERRGIDSSVLNNMITEGLIRWGGIFSLTEKGEQALQNYLLIEKADEQKDKYKILFDSNIFDEIIAGNLEIGELTKFKEKAEFYITHLQVDEINECSDKEKRAKLFLFMGKLAPIIIPTSSFILGKSRLGEARLGDNIIFEELRKGNINHTEDALIGETAIKENLILVTNDKTLIKRVNSKEGQAMNLQEFKELIKRGIK